MSPLLFGLCFLVDGPARLLGPLTLFLTGLCWLLYAREFGADGSNSVKQGRPHQFVNPPNRPALSLPERTSIEGFGSRKVNASDMAEPPSVTDHTTQFFD